MSDHLPDEVLEQILLRLPITALGKFSSVCKSWHNLITTHSFISSHFQLSLSNPTPLLLIRHSTNTLSPSLQQWSLFNTTPLPSRLIAELELPYQTPPDRSFRFVQSIHGIICLVEQSVRDDAIIDYAIILWNPSIRRHLTLQIPASLHLALGFGFDSNNNDFKIIRIFFPDRVELYSLNKGAWKVLDVSYCQEIGVVRFLETHCFVNGNVHWIVDPPISNNENIRLLMFNLEEEKFKMLELPPGLDPALFDRLEVIVIEGCLSVLYYRDFYHWFEQCDCDIWMMIEHGVAESWTKISTVNVQENGPSDVFGLSTSAQVLVLQRNVADRELVSLHFFDPESEEITDLGIQGYKISAWDYTQSLILLDREAL